MFAGQLGQSVQAVRELRVRHSGGRTPCTPAFAPFTETRACGIVLAARRTRRADGGRESREVRRETLSFAPSVRASAPARHHPGEQPLGGVGAQDVLVGRPQRHRPHPADRCRKPDPALRFLFGGAAEREEIELVLRESAHQTVAPESGLTGRIRITTVGEESDPHEHTPDLPCGRPPLEQRLTAGRP